MNLRSFLVDRFLYIALYIGFGTLIVVVVQLDLLFSGASLDLANVFYLWALGLAGLLVFLLVDYRRQVSFMRRLETIESDEPLDRLALLSEPRTLSSESSGTHGSSCMRGLRLNSHKNETEANRMCI